MVGALIAPCPTSAIRYLATKCINRQRLRGWLVPWGTNRCQQVHSFDEPLAKTLDANDIVFSVHVPLPNMEMSPWFQYMLAVLQFDIAFKMINQIEDDVIVTIDAGLAYRDDLMSEWMMKFHSVEQRPLKCIFAVPKTYGNEGHFYHCDPIPIMELGSVAHKYFLINMRLPVNDTVNTGIGEIKDVHIVGIHQNGGFTKVWISMKTVFSPWIFGATTWYWHRVRLIARRPVLLEKVIFALGVSMTFLNVPVEWLSLGFEWTWMLLFEDVRQGVFYSTLFCFWIIFCGEHLMDQSRRNQLSVYWWEIGLVVFGSSILLIFDLSERNIGGKIQQLPGMSEARRRHYKVSESHWHWGDYTLQVYSAFLTGTYGMWNLYVFTIIFLYAPSHKHNRHKSGDQRHIDMTEKLENQETQLTCGEQVPTEAYRIIGKVAEE
ncbi:hypothetical protein Q8A73_008523 [Channa argus]|nr:hypothetical protein Q8A73_008523 [Channa argus]